MALFVKFRHSFFLAAEGHPRSTGVPPVIALAGIKNKAQVEDMGIDGRIYPPSSMPKGGKKAGELAFMDTWYPNQVKQKDKAGRPDIDSFEAVMLREDRSKGFFVSFDFTHDAMTEIDAFSRREHRVIVPLTVRDILDEEIAAKLAGRQLRCQNFRTEIQTVPLPIFQGC
jgi:hypothetical protein